MTATRVQTMTVTPSVEIVDVTPDLAREWLGYNTKNRRTKPRSIECYARDMAQGNWRMTGEAIKFTVDGRLIDGQNRLYAVIMADVSVRMMVIRGLADEAQDVMDGGARRTNADQLGLHDVRNASLVATIATVWCAWRDGTWLHSGSQKSSPPLTHAEVLHLYRQFPELADAARVAMRVRKSLPIPPGVIGAAWIEFARIDADDANEFFDRIASIRTSGSGDPIATILKRVLSDRADGRRQWNAESLYMVVRTWNAFRSGETLGHFKTGKNKFGRDGAATYPSIPEPK